MCLLVQRINLSSECLKINPADRGFPIFRRISIYAIARICHANSVHLSVRDTRVLHQNG